MKILVYHGIVKKLDDFDKFFPKNILIEDFRRQIAFFRKKYQFLSLEEFNYLWQHRKLKEGQMMIFFDDCYKSALNGAEILKKFEIPVIFSVSSDLVNKGYFWGDDIEKALINTKKTIIEFNKLSFDISTQRKKIDMILALKKYFRNISANTIKRKLNELLASCRINPRAIAEPKFGIMSWEEIKQIQARHFFSIVHHGHMHYPLSKFPNKKSLVHDIATNVKILREKLKIEPFVFAYPFGEKNDYNEEVKIILKNHSFKFGFGFSTDNREVINYKYKNTFDIPRIMA